MKELILVLSAVISTSAWADLSQLQKVLGDSQVQAALPADRILGVTVSPVDSQQCLSTFVVNAQYPNYSCSLNVLINSCAAGIATVGPVNCESTAQIMDVTLASPTFSKDIRPIFQAKCTACHGSGKMRPTDYTNYATASGNAGAINQHVVSDKDMPMGGSMAQSQRDLVGAWINAGAPK